MKGGSGERLADGEVDPLTRWPVGQGDPLMVVAAGGERLAVGNTNEQRETGNRRACCGPFFRSRVSANRRRVRVIRFRFGFRKSALDAALHFGWQVAAPGGGWRDIRPPSSALCHLSSMQPSIQSSTQSSIQPSVIGSAQPEAARSARSADPTPRHALPRYSILHTRYSHHSPAAVSSRWSWNRAWKLSA